MDIEEVGRSRLGSQLRGVGFEVVNLRTQFRRHSSRFIAQMSSLASRYIGGFVRQADRFVPSHRSPAAPANGVENEHRRGSDGTSCQ